MGSEWFYPSALAIFGPGSLSFQLWKVIPLVKIQLALLAPKLQLVYHHVPFRHQFHGYHGYHGYHVLNFQTHPNITWLVIYPIVSCPMNSHEISMWNSRLNHLFPTARPPNSHILALLPPSSSATDPHVEKNEAPQQKHRVLLSGNLLHSYGKWMAHL